MYPLPAKSERQLCEVIFSRTLKHKEYISQTDRFQVQGSKFKGYNRLKLHKILIKIQNARHNLLGGTVLNPR